MPDSTNSLSFRIAQVAGIIGSAAASGGIITISFFSIPPLFLPPPAGKSTPKPRPKPTITSNNIPRPATPTPHLLHQWLYIYTAGANTFPKLVAGSALAYLYLACVLHERKHNSHHHRNRNRVLARMYLAAGVVTVAAILYSLAFIEGTVDRLMAIAKRMGVDGGGAAEQQQGEEEVVVEGARREQHDTDREVPKLIARWGRLNIGRAVFPLVGALIGAVAAFR